MKNYIKKKIFSITMLFVILFSSLFSIVDSSVVKGAIIGSNKYTSVLEDLQTDESFKVEDYPVIIDNYSINVIGISESSDKELFIYTYEPCGDSCNINASSINISLELHNDINVKNYSLIHIDSNGVFGKYKVNDLQVKNDTTRYYEIVSIYRKWNSEIDNGSGNDNIINEVVYKVGKMFTASTTSKGVAYGVTETEVVELTGYKIGTLRYKGGFHLAQHLEYVDSHYVVFDVSFDIDKVYEADVSYVSQFVEEDTYLWDTDVTYNEKENKIAYLNYTQKYERTDSFLFWERTYSWNRIEKVSDFIANEDLTEETENSIKNMQYVLRFAETELHQYNIGDTYCEDYTIISEVTILRLKYEVDGKVYNMGVVMNKQTDDGIPDNIVGNGEWELRDGIEILIALVLLVILFVILSPVLPIIFGAIGFIIRFLWKCIKFIFKLIWNIISFPFKFMNDGFK